MIPLQELKLKVPKLPELATEIEQQTGDTSHFKDAVKAARMLYESKMKEAANVGRLDRAYLNRVGAALELVEAIAARS